MKNNVLVKAPAKLNLFLRILGKKKNNFHIIRTGVTFLNLQNKITISLSNKNNLSYSGPFRPISSIYKNDIIKKVLNNISKKKEFKVKINIEKNIPTQAGLGSASTDAASFIKGLQKLDLINNIDNSFLNKIGSDVPICYYAQNCLATGTGNIINKKIDFPKYYFVLVNPNIQLSTSEMYSKIKNFIKFDKNYKKKFYNLNALSINDKGNDFEKIVIKEKKIISDLLNFLSNLNNNIFSRMTGSGACCYAVFKNRKNAKLAKNLILKKYPNYWIYLAENNIYNN